MTDHAEWLRLRKALSPNCIDDTHVLEMRHFLDSPTHSKVFVFAKDDTTLGGFIEVSVRERVDGSFSRQVGYVDGWYVEPELRHQDIGRRLLRAAERWTIRQGLCELASDCDANAAEAIQAHADAGFHEAFRLVHFLKRVESKRRPVSDPVEEEYTATDTQRIDYGERFAPQPSAPDFKV
jgi:aminoglycoside 6'-N-acetyltransferase I